MFNTLGGGTMSTSGDILSTSGDILSTSGDGCSVRWRDNMSTSGDAQYIGEYHWYIGGIS